MGEMPRAGAGATVPLPLTFPTTPTLARGPVSLSDAFVPLSVSALAFLELSMTVTSVA
jgi:hypothetical protein